jgi:hypothetical protein
MPMMLGGKCTDKRVDEREERSMMFVIMSRLTNFCNRKHTLMLISMITEVAGMKPFTARSFLQKIAELYEMKKLKRLLHATFELV